MYMLAWAVRLYSLPFLLPILLFIDIPPLSERYWIALFVGGSINVVTTILYIKAIKISDVSVVVPLVSFTPAFLLVTSPIILGEVPSPLGMFGVMLVVAGSYFLNIREKEKGFFKPFKYLLKDKGSRYMIIVAILWSISSNFDKIGVGESSPLFWAISANIFIAIAMTPFVLFKARKYLRDVLEKFKVHFPIGFFGAATLVFQMLAINLIYVSYVISIKRTSVILVVFAGFFLFKEKNITTRITGALLMLAGVILISVF